MQWLFGLFFTREEGHESEVAEVFCFVAVLPDSGDALHHFHIAFTYGDDQFAIHFELVEQGLGDACGAGCDEDSVEWCVPRESEVSVTVVGANLAVAHFFEQCGGQFVQGLVPFDRVHLAAHFCQHAGLVSRAGSDFHHFHPALCFEQATLEGHGKRLRDGLIAFDGEGGVLVSPFVKCFVQEKVARNFGHRCEDGLVDDTLFPEVGDELSPQAFMPVCIHLWFHVSNIEKLINMISFVFLR